MWQVPMLGVTITGGFWYGALVISEMSGMNRALFIMCAVLDLALIAVLRRMRYVMGQYLTKLEEFSPQTYVSARGEKAKPFTESYVVAWAFSFALGTAAVLSLVMAFVPQVLGASH